MRWPAFTRWRWAVQPTPLFLLLLVWGTLPLASRAQNVTLSGFIKDEASGEALIAAQIVAMEAETGTYSNDYGFFSLSLPQGKYTIITTYMGYAADTQVVDLQGSAKLDIELKSADAYADEVEITEERKDQNVTSTDMGNIKLNVETIKTMPALFGEVDVIRTLQLMPGVQSAGDGNSSIFVRGGNYDQNLLLLDEATVYNASHLLGFFSVFNSDAIKDVNLLKGNMPSQYGGRLSSVIDVRMNEGNMKQFHLKGGVGLLSSRLTVEGPIIKDKCSFIVTGRRTYADLFLQLSSDEALRNNQLYFYDLNAKVNYQINPNNRLYLSGYFGQDVLNLNNFKTDWGNKTATLRWNHVYGDRLFSNTSFIFSDFVYGFEVNEKDNNFRYGSGIQDFGLKQDFDFFLNPNHTLTFGAQATHHRFTLGKVEPLGRANAIPFNLPRRLALDIAAYVGHRWKISPRVSLDYGLRYAWFAQLGNDTTFVMNPENLFRPVDSMIYSQGQIVYSTGGLEPRFAIRVGLNPQSSVKFAYSRTQQFIQVASNATASLPTDLWVPTTAIIKPQSAHQLSLGYFCNFRSDMFETSVEVYWKRLYNQIEFKNDAQIYTNKFLDHQFIYGDGWAYGAEFYVRKAKGKTTGWISYTLSWSERQFAEINEGKRFYGRNDRRHSLSVVVSHEFSPRWTVSGSWTYSTGIPTTLPEAKYFIDGFNIGVYSERYGYRLPDYHRLDLSVTFNGKQTRKWKSSWNFSIYNIYARKNPWGIRLETSQDGTTQQAKMVYLFTIVPSITYNFSF